MAPLFSEAYCHQCGWESGREENGYSTTSRLARKHVADNTTHTVYVEQARLVVYSGRHAGTDVP